MATAGPMDSFVKKIKLAGGPTKLQPDDEDIQRTLLFDEQVLLPLAEVQADLQQMAAEIDELVKCNTSDALLEASYVEDQRLDLFQCTTTSTMQSTLTKCRAS